MLLLLFSCTSPRNEPVLESPTPPPQHLDKEVSTPIELSDAQANAFDALNKLQVSTDEMHRLYSTFAGTASPCYHPDTVLSISQADLLVAMKKFVNTYCTSLSDSEREKLAQASVLAQEAYDISVCSDTPYDGTIQNALPMTGTWVMRNLLGRRDVVIVW